MAEVGESVSLKQVNVSVLKFLIFHGFLRLFLVERKIPFGRGKGFKSFKLPVKVKVGRGSDNNVRNSKKGLKESGKVFKSRGGTTNC